MWVQSKLRGIHSDTSNGTSFRQSIHLDMVLGISEETLEIDLTSRPLVITCSMNHTLTWAVFISSFLESYSDNQNFTDSAPRQQLLAGYIGPLWFLSLANGTVGILIIIKTGHRLTLEKWSMLHWPLLMQGVPHYGIRVTILHTIFLLSTCPIHLARDERVTNLSLPTILREDIVDQLWMLSSYYWKVASVYSLPLFYQKDVGAIKQLQRVCFG